MYLKIKTKELELELKDMDLPYEKEITKLALEYLLLLKPKLVEIKSNTKSLI